MVDALPLRIFLASPGDLGAAGLGIHYPGVRPASKTTTLATGQINSSDQLVIELVQASDTPAVVLAR